MGILEELKLNKGQPAMNMGQFQRRILAYNENIWPRALREQYTDAFELWKNQMRPLLAEAETNYGFNQALAAYKGALARLDRYVLAVGRPEVWEDVPTDDPDVTESVLVRPAIDPLDLEVEITSYDENGDPVIETVPNPLIVADEAERANAQVTVDTTPEGVITYAS